MDLTNLTNIYFTHTHKEIHIFKRADWSLQEAVQDNLTQSDACIPVKLVFLIIIITTKRQQAVVLHLHTSF